MPGIAEIVSGEVNAKSMRDVSIADTCLPTGEQASEYKGEAYVEQMKIMTQTKSDALVLA